MKKLGTSHGRILLENTIRKDEFQKRILILRTKYNIEVSEDELTAQKIAKEWEDSLGENFASTLAKLLNDIRSITHEFGFYDPGFTYALLEYLATNKLVFRNPLWGGNLCRIRPRLAEYEREFEMNKQQYRFDHDHRISKSERKSLAEWLKYRRDEFNADCKAYPIILYISSEASINDIDAYLSDNKNEFEFLKKKYKSRDNGGRRRRRTLLNERILYLRRTKGYSLGGIAKAVYEEFGEKLERSHISSIIKLEKNRRS